jgi:hypothetical protein
MEMALVHACLGVLYTSRHALKELKSSLLRRGRQGLHVYIKTEVFWRQAYICAPYMYISRQSPLRGRRTYVCFCMSNKRQSSSRGRHTYVYIKTEPFKRKTYICVLLYISSNTCASVDGHAHVYINQHSYMKQHSRQSC